MAFWLALPITLPEASRMTKFGWVSCGRSWKVPTLPTKMPRAPTGSCFSQYFTRCGLPKKVQPSVPWPSVRVTSSRILGGAPACRTRPTTAITATSSPIGRSASELFSVPER